MTVVTLHLYARFREHVAGAPEVEVAIDPGTTILQLLERYEVPLPEIRIVFCDHRLVGLDHALQGGETVGVFPAIGGG